VGGVGLAWTQDQSNRQAMLAYRDDWAVDPYYLFDFWVMVIDLVYLIVDLVDQQMVQVLRFSVALLVHLDHMNHLKELLLVLLGFYIDHIEPNLHHHTYTYRFQSLLVALLVHLAHLVFLSGYQMNSGD
jgi:hypothetical protein